MRLSYCKYCVWIKSTDIIVENETDFQDITVDILFGH